MVVWEIPSFAFAGTSKSFVTVNVNIVQDCVLLLTTAVLQLICNKLNLVMNGVCMNDCFPNMCVCVFSEMR